MTVTPTKSLSLVLENLRLLVAQAVDFQATVATGGLAESTDAAYLAAIAAAGDQTAALAKIIKHETDENDEQEAAPRAIVRYLSSEESERVALGTWENHGALSLLFEFPVPTTLANAKRGDQLVDFTNKIGAIASQMQQPAGSGFLNVLRFELREIGRYDEDEYNGVAGWGAWFYVFPRGM